jgi:hypothetical protein
MLTKRCSFAHVRISESGVVAAPIVRPVDSLEPVARQPVDPAWRQVHVHEQLHGWRSGTSTSSARQAAYDRASAMSSASR